MMQRALIRCSVITWKSGMGWEVGRRFKREGTYVYLWLIHNDVWQRPAQYCETIIIQLKIRKKNENKKKINSPFLKKKKKEREPEREKKIWRGELI